MTKPTTTAFAKAAGISMGYASDIMNGHRPMPRPLAIHMLGLTGWRHECLANLTIEQIAMLKEIEPWMPPKERTAA